MDGDTTIELNQNFASYIRPNDGFGITLAQGTLMQEGDTIKLRLGSIDSLKADDDTIVITQEIPLSVVYSIYDVDYSATDKRNLSNSAAWPAATFDYYAAYNDNPFREFTSARLSIVGYHAQGVVLDPRGGYQWSPGSFLVDDYSAEMNFLVQANYIDSENAPRTVTLTGGNSGYGVPSNPSGGGPTKVTWYSETGYIDLRVKNGDTIIFKDGSFKLHNAQGQWPGRDTHPGPADIRGVGGSIYPGTKDLFSTPKAVDVLNSQFAFSKAVITSSASPGTTGNVLDLKTSNSSLAPGTYNKPNLAVQLSQLFSDAEGIKAVTAGNQIYTPKNTMLQRTDDPDNSNMIFRKIDQSDPGTDVTFTDANTYQYKDAAGAKEPYFVGASQYALGFENGVFSQNYAHMPLFDYASPGKQNLGLYWTGTVGGGDLRYYKVKQSSGIVFHELNPPEFWADTLGLYAALKVPLYRDSNGVQYYVRDDMDDKITYGFDPLSSFILATNNPNRKMEKIPPAASSPVYLDVTGSTRTIYGQVVQTNVNGGLYLLEIYGLTSRRGGYVDSEFNNPSIQAVISTQYDSNNIITGFGESGLDYTHVGNPYMIKELYVRILDPKTKQPVTGLGNNNVFIFDIIRKQPFSDMQSAEATAQANQKLAVKLSKEAAERLKG